MENKLPIAEGQVGPPYLVHVYTAVVVLSHMQLATYYTSHCMLMYTYICIVIAMMS